LNVKAKTLCFLVTSAVALSAWGTSPDWQKVIPMVKSNPRATLFASAMVKSGLTSSDLGGEYTTFIAPRDGSCSEAQKAALQGADVKKLAKDFVLDHAFHGQLIIYTEVGKLRNVNYVPKVKKIGEHVAIDPGHPLTVKLLSGRTTIVSVAGDVVRIGGAEVLDNRVYDSPDGGEIEVGSCGSL
jgi:hypothetical protein